MINLCQLEGLSCYGCCGHTWGSHQSINAQLRENTRIFGILTRSEFRSRSETVLSQCGACKALVIKDNAIVCGLHPLQNDGVDWRDKNCEKEFLCDTFKKFLCWPKERQEMFLDFIVCKKLSHHSYSMGMDSGKLLEEFCGKYPD